MTEPSTCVAWEWLPYSFIVTSWRYDPECGWLEYCVIPDREVLYNFEGILGWNKNLAVLN